MIQINPLLSIVNQLLQRETLKIADYAQAIRDARQMLNEAFQAGENVLLEINGRFFRQLEIYTGNTKL